MSLLKCPNCGSEKVKVSTEQERNQLTLGDEFTYTVPLHICETCGEEGDFNNTSDSYRETAIAEEKKKLAAKLINDIEKKGLKLSYIERAFELPQRIISSKWKRSGISASALALLRIIDTMPWIVNVADNKFSNKSIGHEIQQILINNGVVLETAPGPVVSMKLTLTSPTFDQSNKYIDIKNDSLTG